MKPITSDMSNPIYKITEKIPQDNQQEWGIPNQIGNHRDEHYSDVFQYRIPRDQKNV